MTEPTKPIDKYLQEMSVQVRCITGECPAEHDNCTYVDYDTGDGSTPETDNIMELITANRQAAIDKTEILVLEARIDELTWFRGYCHKEMSDTTWQYLNNRIAELTTQLRALKQKGKA